MDTLRLLAVSYYLVLIGYLAFYDVSSTALFSGVQISIFDLFFLLLFIVYLYNIVTGSLSIPYWRRGVNIAVLVYLLVATLFPILGYFIYEHPVGVLSSPLRQLQLLMFLPITASLVQARVVTFRGLLYVTSVVVVLHTFVGVLRFLEIDTLIFPFAFEAMITADTITQNPDRSAGLFGSVMWFGTLMAVCFLFGVAALEIENIPRLPTIAILLLSPIGLMIGVSRTGLIMTVPGVVYLLYANRRFAPQIVLFGALSLIMINNVTSGGTVSRFGELIYLLTGDIGEISSLQVRFENWQLGINLFQEYIPFGTLVSHSYVKEKIITDNMYVNWLLQAGIVGVVSLVFIYTSTLICSVSEYGRKQTQSISLLTTLFISSAAVGSLTTDLLGYTPVVVVFWVVLGLAFGTFESGRIEFEVSGYSSR